MVQLSATPRMPSCLQAFRRNLPLHHPTKARYILSCKATDGSVDRRGVLLRLLGGTAAAGISKHGGALAAGPIQSPNLEDCRLINHENVPPGTNCCPTYNASIPIIDFKLPPSSSPLRVRPAAHLVDSEYLAKYERAVELMKQLPPDDPRSFMQQWHVHCAYCDGAYDQIGFPDLELQIHGCWLFFPWHRLYLYFYERILGKLIGDDSFALPFWNWDAPDGMALPAIYTRESSPLYDMKHNPKHQPPFPLDLDYNGTDPNIPKEELIDRNLKLMYHQVIAGAKKPELFMGQPYYAGGQANPGAGTIENLPHDPVHNWTGESQPPNLDMGNFYSAARDPVFFAHHGNVDRMWTVWRRSHADFAKADWLDSNFLFYDEEARLVRVRVRDCLNTHDLRYTYQDVPLPWLSAIPTKAGRAGTPVKPPTGALPATLEETVRVTVGRPQISRSRFQKDEEEEVLIIEGIEIADSSRYVKFDVYVNEPAVGRAVNVADAEFAGSVALTPHMEKGTIKTTAKFGISDLLDDIGADDKKTILVSLVPRSAGEVVTVRGVSIGYVK